LDHALVGSKAANLAQAIRAGFRVPAGVVVTTTAEGITEHLIDRVRVLLGEQPLAVRSSATAEDLPNASFAGQYETYLGVEGHDGLADAIEACRASLHSNRVGVYSEGSHEAAIAVLIQPMIDADAAGVAFSANPVTGVRNEIVINAVEGLGDRLVSGDVTPDQWVVSGEIVVEEGDVLHRSQVMEVAGLAQRAETQFGAPQDIEWAIDGDTLWLLQARPITSLPQPPVEPIPIEIEVPAGYWEHDASHAPRANYPIESYIPPMLAEAVKSWATEFGYLFDGIEFRDIGGWTYQRLAPVGGKEGPDLPAWLMWVLVRTVPMIRRRLAMAREAVDTDKAGQFIDRWYDSWLPELQSGIDALRGVDLSKLTDEALLAQLGDARRLCTRGVEIHAMLHGALAIILYELVTVCERLLDWDIAATLETVRGTSYKSTEPARQMAELTRLACDRPDVLEAARLPDSEVVAFLDRTDPLFAEAFGRYVDEFGHVALGQGVVEPTYAEMPSFLIRTISHQVEADFDATSTDEANRAQREETIAAARTLLSTVPADLMQFDIAIERAQKAYPVREDNEFFTMSAPSAQFRYAILEVGNRLTERNVIDTRDDVMYLELSEAVEALDTKVDLCEVVTHRKGQRAWAVANPGPPSYGNETPPPADLSFLPSDTRLPMEAMLWSLHSIMAVEASKTEQGDAAAITGTPASAGTHTGPVRVVNNESEFSKIRAGDVLVCPVTSPVWSVLFPTIGALVTDTGGILSHPAIIAREYRIPAVVATGNATQLLRDGQIVTVDGSAGTVQEEP
jgi:pyruvate,water dikinase